MTVINYENLIKERLRSYDPTIDVTSGSSADVNIIQPILKRLSPDPLDTNISSYITSRLQQDHPDLVFQDGSVVNDYLIGPLTSILDGIKREIREVNKAKDFNNPNTLTTSDVNARLNSLFFERDQGSYSTVRVRAYFANPVSVTIGAANTAYTANSLRFLPLSPTMFTANTVLSNKDSNGYYYIDVTFKAEKPGSKYNVGVGEIIGITGISSAINVTNLSPASPGRDSQSNSEFIDSSKRAIGERSLNTISGIVANLKLEQFPEIDVLQVVGFNDSEMGRDILTGGSLGPMEYQGDDLETSDDGDGDGYTPYIDFAGFSATANMGPVGTDISEYTIIFDNKEYRLNQVEGTNRISIHSSYTGSDRVEEPLSNKIWHIRRSNFLTLSDIPGGILLPSSDGETINVPADSVHVGSCTDIYLRGRSRQTKSLKVESIADEDSIFGEEAVTTAGSDEIELSDLGSSAWSNISVGYDSVHLETGPGGSYRIIEKLAPFIVRVHTTIGSSASNISYALIKDIDMDLIEPKERRWEASDLKTVAGIDKLETTSGDPDFVSIGVSVGDYIDILNGDDEGAYEILNVTSSELTVDTVMTTTASPLQFKIYLSQSGIERPLVRLTDIELADGDLEPTGEKVPYRRPIDIRSRSFQNPGRRAKASTDSSITGDTLSYVSTYVVESSDGSINYYELGVKDGDILNINDSSNAGYYIITTPGGAPGAGISDNQLLLQDALQWSGVSSMSYEAGSPSYGSFRLYFKDPVSFSIRTSEGLFSVTDNSATRTFRPDSTMFDQFLPTTVSEPTTLFTSGSNTLDLYTKSGSVFDPILYEMSVGDRVRATYAPLVGSVNISTTAPGTGPITTINEATLLLNVGNGPERVTFSGTALTASDIVDQINEQLTVSSAYVWEDPSVANSEHIMLRGDYQITILDNSSFPGTDATADVFGTDRTIYQPWLVGAAFVGNDTSNESPINGYYVVFAIDSSSIDVIEYPSGAWSPINTITNVTLGHFIRVEKQGRQSISSTDMMENEDEHGLYYFDVECVSVGFGTPWNIAADLKGEVTGYKSEGWDITTEDEDTSYSMVEVPWISISPRILVAGDPVDVTNKQELAGRNVQISYERDNLVEQVHDYVRERAYRVTCNNPLARCLLPTFIRTSIEYKGGDTKESVRDNIKSLIKSILPDNELEVSDIEALITRSGAKKVTHPIELIAIVHKTDRSLDLERSVDSVSSSRLYGLLPDVDEDGNSRIYLTRLPS